MYLEDRLRERQEIEVTFFFECTKFKITGKSIGNIKYAPEYKAFNMPEMIIRVCLGS